MAVYFSNLKSYLLISYVSPPRLGIFTEAIVSASAALTVPHPRARTRYRFYLVYFHFHLFFPSSPSTLSLSRAVHPLPRTTFGTLAHLFFNRTRPMRGKLRGTDERSILTSPSAMTAGRIRAITLTSARIHLTVRY